MITSWEDPLHYGFQSHLFCKHLPEYRIYTPSQHIKLDTPI